MLGHIGERGGTAEDINPYVDLPSARATPTLKNLTLA